jgi:hypothetical protein
MMLDVARWRPASDVETRTRAAAVAELGGQTAACRPDDELNRIAILRGEVALSLLERDMTPISYLCDPWIPEGLHLIASRPKLGKSTLLRQELAAVAGEGQLFGSPCKQATAVYLSLEEGDRLTRRKFEMAGFSHPALASIIVHFEWRRAQRGSRICGACWMTIPASSTSGSTPSHAFALYPTPGPQRSRRTTRPSLPCTRLPRSGRGWPSG